MLAKLKETPSYWLRRVMAMMIQPVFGIADLTTDIGAIELSVKPYQALIPVLVQALVQQVFGLFTLIMLYQAQNIDLDQHGIMLHGLSNPLPGFMQPAHVAISGSLIQQFRLRHQLEFFRLITANDLALEHRWQQFE